MAAPFEAVHPESDAEAKTSPPSSRGWMKKTALVATLGLGVVAFLAMPGAKKCQSLDFGAFQGKSSLGVDAQMALKADALKSVKKRSLAEKIVMKAMRSTGHKYSQHYEQHEVRSLPADPADAARQMLTKDEIIAYKKQKNADRMRKATNAYCAFNVLEAFVSVVGMGDDINAIIRTCPAPRDGESELACQVNGAILVTWVANAAAKLSYAASNCALNLNVDAVCSVGVTGLVSVMGELAATASLAAATCTGVPPQLTTSKISVLGDQTVRDGRRLLIGEGPIGVGVQCGVDVGMVVANLANMGLSINSAVNSGQCGRVNLDGPINKVSGLYSALCTVDIGGAIAYMSQVVTFINLIVVHCQDFLDVSALCGASISGIITAAAAMAPYGAAVHAACAKGSILKNPKKAEAISSLYTVPTPRRLEELKQLNAVKDAMANLKDLRQQLEAKLGFNASVPTMYSEANMEQMIQLMDDGVGDNTEKSMRGSPVFSEDDLLFTSSSEDKLRKGVGKLAKTSPPSSRGWMKKTALVATLGLGVVAFLAMPGAKKCQSLDFGAFQGKSSLGVDAQMALKADALKSVKKRSLAEKIVMKAMRSTGHKYSQHYEQHEVRSLPADPADAARQMLTKDEIIAYKKQKNADRMRKATNAYCAFNVLEAFVSVVGMGDDINAIIRTCPAPRDGESELACQVNGAILVTWVANAAAKLSYAASNCALNLNVDAVCSVGVTGLVSVMGELAATASLAAATCTGVPPQLTTSKISVLGDQTVRDGRRLLIGEGPIGVGVQCGVDVGMVVANLANMGLSINSAVNSGQCGRVNLDGPINKVSGLYSALCTVDIGGAIAYMSQVVTFINLIVVHCQDFLDVSALCGASISGIITAAAAMAPYGAAVHAACAKGSILKNPKKAEAISSLYTVPTPRRLEELKQLNAVKDAMANLKDLRQQLEAKLGFNASVPTMYSEANMEQMIQLMDDGVGDNTEKSMRGSPVFSEEECDE
ncbi:unnamed protein product [Symbiodinium natans]|uniref:Uncharacterized protein n=1 Tax=Symbiodinium natans TaxID=878477 RepID=A0A812N706_9DINO|nr:unnamed protein product [Symbiodinium natans]